MRRTNHEPPRTEIVRRLGALPELPAGREPLDPSGWTLVWCAVFLVIWLAVLLLVLVYWKGTHA